MRAALYSFSLWDRIMGIISSQIQKMLLTHFRVCLIQLVLTWSPKGKVIIKKKLQSSFSNSVNILSLNRGHIVWDSVHLNALRASEVDVSCAMDGSIKPGDRGSCHQSIFHCTFIIGHCLVRFRFGLRKRFYNKHVCKVLTSAPSLSFCRRCCGRFTCTAS